MMCRPIFYATVCCMLASAVSSLQDDASCTSEQGLQSQPSWSLLQVHRERAGTGSVTSHGAESIVNPSGAAATLDETGYAAVADRCCQAEMKVFIERQILQLGFEVCEPAGVIGLVPWHSCEIGAQTFDILTNDLLGSSVGDCAWLATPGNCKPVPPSCPRFPGIEPLADCGCNVSKAVLLDFGAARIKHNNLNGKGPRTSDPEEIYFESIAEYPPGEPFDLVMKTNDYEGTARHNAIAGKFGRLSIKGSGNPAGWSGEVKLQLSFVRPGTGTPVVLPEFFFAVFDVDATPLLHTKQTVSGKGYKGYVTDAQTDLIASKGADGSTKFTATQVSVPNPTDPEAATPAQRGSMVMYFYDNMASFEFTLGVESDGVEGAPEKWYNFAGKSALMDRCGS